MRSQALDDASDFEHRGPQFVAKGGYPRPARAIAHLACDQVEPKKVAGQGR